VADAIHDAGAVYLPERLHVVRVALKKLRYALELANEVSGARGDGEARTLKRAQDLLGRMHDLQILTDRVRRSRRRLAPPSLSEWRDLDALIVSLEDDCRRLHARYMRMRDDLVAIAGHSQCAPARRAAARRGAARRLIDAWPVRALPDSPRPRRRTRRRLARRHEAAADR